MLNQAIFFWPGCLSLVITWQLRKATCRQFISCLAAKTRMSNCLLTVLLNIDKRICLQNKNTSRDAML